MLYYALIACVKHNIGCNSVITISFGNLFYCWLVSLFNSVGGNTIESFVDFDGMIDVSSLPLEKKNKSITLE